MDKPITIEGLIEKYKEDLIIYNPNKDNPTEEKKKYCRGVFLTTKMIIKDLESLQQAQQKYANRCETNKCDRDSKYYETT